MDEREKQIRGIKTAYGVLIDTDYLLTIIDGLREREKIWEADVELNHHLIQENGELHARLAAIEKAVEPIVEAFDSQQLKSESTWPKTYTVIANDFIRNLIKP